MRVRDRAQPVGGACAGRCVTSGELAQRPRRVILCRGSESLPAHSSRDFESELRELRAHVLAMERVPNGLSGSPSTLFAGPPLKRSAMQKRSTPRLTATSWRFTR